MVDTSDRGNIVEVKFILLNLIITSEHPERTLNESVPDWTAVYVTLTWPFAPVVHRHIVKCSRAGLDDYRLCFPMVAVRILHSM